MKRLLAILLTLGVASGCRRAEPTPPPLPARLTVTFLDRDESLGLPKILSGAWSFMDAGLWRPLEVAWTPEGRVGRAVVPRTAPEWVLLRDPEGGIHRICRPGTEVAQRDTDALQDDEREWLATLGLLWALLWVRR